MGTNFHPQSKRWTLSARGLGAANGAIRFDGASSEGGDSHRVRNEGRRRVLRPGLPLHEAALQ